MTVASPPTTTSRPLAEFTRMIRSRNAGSFVVSIDVIFRNQDSYRCALENNVFDPVRIAGLYHLEPSAVHVIPHEITWGIKITMPRQKPSGALTDSDIDSAQSYVPLLALTILDQGVRGGDR